MSGPPRALLRFLCAILVLALALPAFAAPVAPGLAPATGQASCCCGTGACCAPTAPCCVKEGDRRAPEPTTELAAPAPQPRLAEQGSPLAAAFTRALASPARDLVPTASPAESRLHLRQAVFRT